jgi:hypothetical protein
MRVELDNEPIRIGTSGQIEYGILGFHCRRALGGQMEASAGRGSPKSRRRRMIGNIRG